MIFRLFFRLFVTIFAISVASVHSDIDIRYLRGSYANLKETQFSILHGAAAKKKLTNLFLFNSNQTEIEKLVKQLFHQINGQLVPPAAISRPASYLSFHTLGLLVAAMHQNFPKLLVQDLKKTITELYDAKAAAEFTPENLLAEATQARIKKNKTRFTRELELFFKTLSTVLAKPEYNYDAYAAVLGLLYVKAGSLNDLDLYYQGLAKGFNIEVDKLFNLNKIDNNVYSHDIVVELFKSLQSSFINSDFAENLAKTPLNFEEAICSMLLINKAGNNLPQEIGYCGGVMFEKHGYPDCFETSLRNVLQALTFDSNTGLCSLENLKNYGINPDAIDEGLKRFYTLPITTEKYTVSPCDPAQAGDMACHNAFSAVVSNRPWVTYAHHINGDNSKSIYLKLPSNEDYQPFLAASQESNIQSDSNGCCKVKNITLLPAHDQNENKTYEVKSTLKNFIIVLDQLLKLNLFTDPNNTLEKIYWNNDFEEKQFERIAQRFNWQYEISAHCDTTVKISKYSYYSFSIRFHHNVHTEYKVIKNNSQEHLTQLSVFEIAPVNKLFTYATCASIVRDEDKTKLFDQNPEHPFSNDLLYFCDMENPTNRYEVFKTIVTQKTITPAQQALAKKILLFPSPIDDYYHRSMVIPIFTTNIDVCKKLAQQDNPVKILLLTIGMLHDDKKIISALLNASTTDTKIDIDWEFLCKHIVKHSEQKFVLSLIESLAMYKDRNVIGTLLSKFLEACPNKQEKEKIFKKIDSLLKNEALETSTKTSLNIAIDREKLSLCQDNQSRDEIALKIFQYCCNDNTFRIHTQQLLNVFDLLLSKQYPVESIIEHALPKKKSLHFFCDTFVSEKELSLFKWLAQKGLELPEACNVAIKGLEKGNPKAYDIFSLLIKQKLHVDQIIEAALSAFDNYDSKVNSLSLKLFEFLIENGFASSQIAQKITENLATPQNFFSNLNTCLLKKINLLLLLLEKNLEIDQICQAAATLFINNNVQPAMKIFNMLLEKGYGRKEFLYAIFQKPEAKISHSYDYSEIPLNKLLDNDFDFVKSEALTAVDSENSILVRGALSVFKKLIEKNKVYEEALQCVEKTITSSDPTIKNAALDLLYAIYQKQNKSDKTYPALLERITLALQQGISENISLSTTGQNLLQSIIEKGLAFETGLKIAQAYLEKENRFDIDFSLRLFRVFAEKEIYLPESLRAAQKVIPKQENRFEAIKLLIELIKKGMGLDLGNDLNFITNFISDNNICLQIDMYPITSLAKELVAKGYCHESATKIIMYSINAHSRTISYTEIELLKKLFMNDYTTPELIDAIASRLAKSNDTLLHKTIISLFGELLPSRENHESIHTVANRLLNEGSNDNKQLGFKLLISLVEQNYRPAFEFPLTTIKEFMHQANDFSLDDRAQSYLEALIINKYNLDELNQTLTEWDQDPLFKPDVKRLITLSNTQLANKKRQTITDLNQQGNPKRSKKDI